MSVRDKWDRFWYGEWDEIVMECQKELGGTGFP